VGADGEILGPKLEEVVAGKVFTSRNSNLLVAAPNPRQRDFLVLLSFRSSWCAWAFLLHQAEQPRVEVFAILQVMLSQIAFLLEAALFQNFR